MLLKTVVIIGPVKRKSGQNISKFQSDTCILNKWKVNCKIK